jgi:hypothetical protein
MPTRLTMDLAFFAQERRVIDHSDWWPRIAKWQRDGLVRLRWTDSRFVCLVSLTDEGLKRL